MRTASLTLWILAAFAAASPASAFERVRNEANASLAPYALEPQTLTVRRAGRTLASFDVGDQAVTLTAYGRRARARAMGNADDVRHARSMGKVFDGAPQPALVTFEASLKF